MEKKNKGYCEYCGGKIVLKYTADGTYSKCPKYYDRTTGLKLTHECWKCENAKFFSVKHTEFYINVRPTLTQDNK